MKELLTPRAGAEAPDYTGKFLAPALAIGHSAAGAWRGASAMKVIDEENWSWMLFAEGEVLYLSVVCGTVGVYEIVVELDAAEAADYRCDGRSAAARIAGAIAFSPGRFAARNRSDFHERPGVADAIAAWRSNKR